MKYLLFTTLLLTLVSCNLLGKKKHKYQIHIINKTRSLSGSAFTKPTIISTEQASDSLAYREGAAAFVAAYQERLRKKQQGDETPTYPASFMVYNNEGRDIQSNISQAFRASLERFIATNCRP